MEDFIWHVCKSVTLSGSYVRDAIYKYALMKSYDHSVTPQYQEKLFDNCYLRLGITILMAGAPYSKPKYTIHQKARHCLTILSDMKGKRKE